MHTSDYRARLMRVLAASSDHVAGKLRRFQDAATDAVVIDLFLGQDGEGPFDVWVRFTGEEAFVLDRRFDDERQIFGVVWGEEGWDPDVPSRPQGWSWEDLEDAVFETVAEWLEPLIPEGDQVWELNSVDGAAEPRPLRAQG
ncbi:DUF6389 family protein [Microbacterium oxydans]|uniref:DUF6389 family protein n=1 Tax=Microbacterium oxydans TaxID=82380 RepID=UPI0036709137